MENNKNLSRAKEWYLEAINSFSYQSTNNQTGERISFPVSFSEVQNARRLITEIGKLSVQDASFQNDLNSLKDICNRAVKRKLRPSWAMLISVLVWSIVNVFIAQDDIFLRLEGFHNAEQADSLYNEEKKYLQARIEHYQNKIDEEDSAEWLKKFNERLQTLNAKSPDEFLDQKNGEIKDKAKKELMGAGASLVLLGLYLFAVRTPMFLIYRRRKQVEWNMERGYTPGIINSVFAALIAIPVPEAKMYTVEVKYTDGTSEVKTQIESGAGMLAAKWGLILLAMFLTFMVMLYLLPFAIIYKYLRNYQYALFYRISKSFSRKS